MSVSNSVICCIFLEGQVYLKGFCTLWKQFAKKMPTLQWRGKKKTCSDIFDKEHTDAFFFIYWKRSTYYQQTSSSMQDSKSPEYQPQCPRLAWQIWQLSSLPQPRQASLNHLVNKDLCFDALSLVFATLDICIDFAVCLTVCMSIFVVGLCAVILFLHAISMVVISFGNFH